MTEAVKSSRDQWRNLAKNVARAETPKRKLTFIGQQGKTEEHKLYVSGTPYELAYPNDPDNTLSPITNPAECQDTIYSITAPAVPESMPEVVMVPAMSETTQEIAPALMQISTFPHTKNSTATSVSISKQEFRSMFSEHCLRNKKDGGLFAPSLFDGARGKGKFISADGICIDYDYGQPNIQAALKLFPETMVVYYSTHSHCWKSKEQKKKNDDGSTTVIPADTTYTPKNQHFRLVIPLSRTVNVEEHARLVKGIMTIFPAEQLEWIDTTCFEKDRPHYLPSCIPEHKQYAFTGFQDGEPLSVVWLLRLADKLETVKVVKPTQSPAPVDTPRPTPEQVVSRCYEYTDTGSGEVIDLAKWAAQNPHFDLVAAIGQQYKRAKLKDGKQHIACPFEDQHTYQADDMATFAANASPPQFAAFDVHCCHAHCAGRDRLEFILAMLEKGWLTADQLQPSAPVALELKRPPYFNYRAQETAAELVKQPLRPEEFQYHLHLMHVAGTAYDGTLPDDSWTLSRILGIAEGRWLEEIRPTLIRSGWLIVENGRIFNPMTLREYQVAQNELARKIAGGKNGGLKTQQIKREREAHLQG